MTVNVGSSSTRVHLYRGSASGNLVLRESRSLLRRAHGALDVRQLCESFAALGPISAVAHRFVHGGPQLRDTRRIFPETRMQLEDNAYLAPLHTPAALTWVEACSQALGTHVPQYAVFDTAFFTTLPPRAATYALPAALVEAHGIRRYGFHGLAHASMWQTWREQRPDLPKGGRLVTLQLGSGCSATAILNGQAVDTSMGFSPLEGLPMGTRAGDLDPGILLYLQGRGGLSLVDIEDVLLHRSGLFGVAGTSDMEELAARDDASARLARELFCYRVAKYIAAFAVPLNGMDGVVFGGGIGENAPTIRRDIIAQLAFLGLSVDAEANTSSEFPRRITGSEGGPAAWVVRTNEAAILADEALKQLTATQPKREQHGAMGDLTQG